MRFGGQVETWVSYQSAFKSYAESTPFLGLTLKAFANSSPGLRFGNPGIKRHQMEDATLQGLRRRS